MKILKVKLLILFLGISITGASFFCTKIEAMVFTVPTESNYSIGVDKREESPYQSILYLNFSRTTKTSRSTAVLIGRDYALTAAHSIGSWKSGSVTAIVNGKKVKWEIESTVASPDFKRGSAANDYGIIKIKPNGSTHIGDVIKPLTISPVSVGKEIKKGTTLAMLGFPSFNGQTLYYTNYKILSAPSSMNGEAVTSGGSSGQPVLNNSSQIVGVYHGGGSSATLTSYKEQKILEWGLKNESSRLYIYDDKSNWLSNKNKINPTGNYIEKKNGESISKNELDNIKKSKIGYTIEYYTDDFKKYDLNNSINMLIGGQSIYPIYLANKYSVKFDSNVSSSGNMSDQTFTYDTAQNLTNNSFLRPGYKFDSWNTLKNGTGFKYTDSNLVKNLTSYPDGVITLYAQWTANDQTITFDPNNGKTDQKAISGKTDATVDLKDVKVATRDGYTFAGWFTNKTDGIAKPDSIVMPNGGVTYYAQWRINQESAIVSYIDDTKNTTITTDNLSGDYGTIDAYRTQEIIDKYKKEGYEFISDNYPSEGVLYDKAGIVQKFEVHLKHRTTTETENTTVSQTVHYVYSDGTKAPDDYVRSLNFSREVETDLVTSNKTYTDWKPETGTSFSSVKSPDIIGYTPDIKEISAVDNVTGGSTNTETTVTYTANNESARVTYIDDTTGKTLSVSELSGKFGTRDSYQTKASIKTYVDAGYELVSDNYPIDGVTYDKAGILQEFEVHLKHVTSNKTETKTITRTIHYNYSDGSTASKDHISTLSFIRVETIDVATGKVSYGDWQSVEKTTTFDAVVSPTITGYSADSPIMKEVSYISSESKDINQTVTYSLNTETASVTYIDDTTGNILRTDELSGLYGSTDKYKTSDKIDSYLAKGYVKVSDDYPSTGVVYNKSDVKKTYTVHLKHGISNSVETRTVSQVIHYQYSDGTKAFEDYKAKLIFKSTVTTDLVTGVKIYGDWQAVDGTTFKEVASPSIEGYTPNAKNVPAIDNITGSSYDIDLTIVYTKNPTKKVPTKEIDNPTPPGVTTGGGTLPKTGEDTTSVYAILGMFVLGLGSYLGIHKKRKSEKQSR